MSVLNSIFHLFRFNSKNWKAISLCFFTATIFWFFNALNKNYTTNLTFPLQFDYDEENYVAVNPLPNAVRLNVTGIGWDLFRRSSGLKLPSLIIPLERPSEVRKIVTVPALFVNQLERFEINFVLTDTLRIELEPKEKRYIKLKLDLETISLRNGFTRINDPLLEPDSIYVEGPRSVVNSFIEPVYLRLGETNIDENYQEDVEVQFLQNELIKRNPPTVSVNFEVDRLVELSDSIPLVVINYPEGANPFLGIKTLPCRFAVPESRLNSYAPDSVKAVLDLRNFKRGSIRIKPQVEGLPSYSRVLAIDSIYVKL